jgi:hypothetical protein
MSDIKNSPPPTVSDTTVVTCDLYNPTTARRVIFDGTKEMKAITIEPGETKRNAKITKAIAEELKARNLAVKDSDLKPMKPSEAA